ncbi:MAG: hypothetical protein OXG05_03835 [Gammaproteobacteria bacterium]|nr:hypothetical protein [Gammaproteobacteria bacterium]
MSIRSALVKGCFRLNTWELHTKYPWLRHKSVWFLRVTIVIVGVITFPLHLVIYGFGETIDRILSSWQQVSAIAKRERAEVSTDDGV